MWLVLALVGGTSRLFKESIDPELFVQSSRIVVNILLVKINDIMVQKTASSSFYLEFHCILKIFRNSPIDLPFILQFPNQSPIKLSIMYKINIFHFTEYEVI